MITYPPLKKGKKKVTYLLFAMFVVLDVLYAGALGCIHMTLVFVAWGHIFHDALTCPALEANLPL